MIMSLSSKIGVGSLSGTALCIYYGGIGTIFWIFISTFILSIISYVENALAIAYKENGISGPFMYIEKGLQNKLLSTIYAIIVIIAYILLFTSIQSNTITTITTSMFYINKYIISIFISLISGIAVLKGIKGISNICNKIFPIMMTIYIIIGLIVLIKNISSIPLIIKAIINSAFKTNSVSGGLIHTIIIAFQRSIFANESGVGTGAIIAGSTTSNDIKNQAKLGIIQTFFINIVILGITSLIIVTANTDAINITNGIELTKSAFYYHLNIPGEILLIIIITLFSFSTIITIYYYGESSVYFLSNKNNNVTALKILTLLSVFVGGIINAYYIWQLIDIILAILTIINMYAVFMLRESIVSKLKNK